MSEHARFDPSRRLRSSPAWELVPLDRLGPRDRVSLGADLPPDTYGVLVSREPAAPPKIAGPDTALLFLTLREPGGVPSYVRATFGADADDALATLVADGILEVESAVGWISGPAAFREAARTRAARHWARSGSIADRSERALRAAAALPDADGDALASFLYRYGTTPILPARGRDWADSESIRASFALDSVAGGAALSKDRAWFVFEGNAGPGEGACPKLYAGIQVGVLREAMQRIAALFHGAADDAPAFKIGASAAGLHRPDRLVFYPASREIAAQWADKLAQALNGLPPDPVPFTAAMEPEGRVSAGADPPRASRAWWDDDGSWRGSITKTLGKALAAARAAGEARPWDFARERLRLAGVDPETWAPLDGKLAL
jgi:hypothetical protein